jgi:hypothetical protein
LELGTKEKQQGNEVMNRKGLILQSKESLHALLISLELIPSTLDLLDVRLTLSHQQILIEKTHKRHGSLLKQSTIYLFGNQLFSTKHFHYSQQLSQPIQQRHHQQSNISSFIHTRSQELS